MASLRIVIVGNGISGITAARFIRKMDSEAQITVISSETKYFYSRTALMYVYMNHMRPQDTEPYERDFWAKNRIDLVQTEVKEIDFQTQTINDTYPYDRLILAVGSRPNFFGWKGQELDGVHGLYHWQDLEALNRHTEAGLKRAVIVGGGLIGIELAEMLLSRGIEVHYLVREKSFWQHILPKEESKMINEEIRHHGVTLHLETELSEILDAGNGKVGGVLTKNGKLIDCDYIGITVGVSPNIEFLSKMKNTDLRLGRGILVNEFLETNIQNVYAIGDCAEQQHPKPDRRAIEAVWYTGRMMGEVAAYNVLGKKVAYDPQIWFNSAKFMNIEYQIYGNIPSDLPNEKYDTIFWQHPQEKKSIRLVYEKESQVVVGFNLLGVRYRQEVCEKWLKERTTIDIILQNLSLANFDPEFYQEYEQEVRRVFETQTGRQITNTPPKRSLDAVLRFLGKR